MTDLRIREAGDARRCAEEERNLKLVAEEKHMVVEMRARQDVTVNEWLCKEQEGL